MTILSAFEAIIQCATVAKPCLVGGDDIFYRLDMEHLKPVSDDIDYLAEQFGIEPSHAALFAILVELSKGADIDEETLSHKLQMSFIGLLGLEEAIQALEKARLVRRTRHDLCIPMDVLKQIRTNQAYKYPHVTGLSTHEIMSRISLAIMSAAIRESSMRYTVEQIDDLILDNPQTSIASTLNEYGIRGTIVVERKGLSEGGLDCDIILAERMLLYVLCSLYYERGDDDVTMWELRRYIDSEYFPMLESAIMNETSLLQNVGVIGFAKDGMLADKSCIKITDEVKEKIFADTRGMQGSNGKIPGVIDPEIIPARELYYDESVHRQVERLSAMLEEERFSSIEGVLRDKGLRPGFTCLFYGPPGTGKTETVYQLAKKAGRGIVMVDVSKIKSMWVGESEKNIRNIFARYAMCVRRYGKAPILCFNEADAIFGIRKAGAEDAVDKMENSIQNILLQGMENIRGILIATTNLTGNLDKAFERRFLYKIHFNVPSVDVRSKIWKSMIPELAGSQADELASQFSFSGGQIENVSRKRLVQSVMTGEDPAFGDIVGFCREECIEESAARKIGFANNKNL